jgi:phosphopantothenoylcysteine decarboxylase / phosphopantothenate---cysteine ligase
MSKSKILFQLSGSIACFKACALLSKLVQAGYEVEVAASSSALKFVGEATLEGLTGRRVHKDTFEAGSYMNHIHLVRWADLILLCPASANTLNKFSAGIGDDLLSTMFLAHDFKKPYLVAPAMNQFMWSHPATRDSIQKLQSWGLEVLGTGAGNLACGEVGEGRMLEPEQIFDAIELALAGAPFKRGTSFDSDGKTVTSGDVQNSERAGGQRVRKILITSGGTEEPIDGVRAITNTSTGRTGAELAEWFAAQGNSVTLLRSKSAVAPKDAASIRTVVFSSFKSLETELKSLLTSESFDAVIHLAAVADYSVATVEANGASYPAPLREKLDSGEELTLKLKKNPKLVDSIRALSKNPNVKVVAFKLTSTSSEQVRKQAVQALAAHSHADVIVHNDATQISQASHPFTVYGADSSRSGNSPIALAQAEGAKNLAFVLDQMIGGSL